MTHQRPMGRAVLCVVLASTALSLACRDVVTDPHLSGAALSQSAERPFSARCEASVDQSQQPSGQTLLAGQGTCQINHLGKSQYVLSLTVDPVQGSLSGTATFTAANGDVLRATIAGPFAAGANLSTLQTTATFAGGTGRFASATGTASLARGVGAGKAIDIYSGTIGYDASGQPSSAAPVALEIAPGGVLLTGAGAQQQLTAYAVDAAGQRTPVTATFSSSRPGSVSATASGLLTALTATGSSQIVAQANGLTSAPVLVVVATPATGALLVSDDQIEGPLTPVDPTAEYVVGWQGRIRLLGVTPAVGQIVLASGEFPLAGRVTAVTPVGAGVVEIEFELVPLGTLFSALSVNEQIPLATAPLASAGPGGAAVRAPTPNPARLRTAPAVPGARPFSLMSPGTGLASALAEFKFNLGAFECEAKLDAGITVPITLDLVDFQIDPDLTLDLIVTATDVERFVVHGTIAHRFSANPLLKGAVKGSFECKVTLKTIQLPVPGPIGVFLGGQIPLGVGFGFEAKTELGEFGFDAFHQGTISAALGFDCTTACQAVTELTRSGGGFFKPVIPANLGDLKVELAGGFFGWAELKIGSRQVPELQFKILEAKAGLEEKAELATERVQALDDGYASKTQLAPVVEASTTPKLSGLKGLINVEIPSLKFAPTLPLLAESPKGTLQISPATVQAGNAQMLGETATFTVTLDPVTYVGSYAVDGVEIRWLRQDENGNPILEPGRPGCTAFQPTTGQTVFTCTTDFLEEHEGEQTFFAFVTPRLYGHVLPFAFEVGSAKVQVTRESITVAVSPSQVTLTPGATQQFTATVTGNTAVTWTAAGGTITSAGLYTAGSTPGAYFVTATSVEDPSKDGSATVTIDEPIETIFVPTNGSSVTSGTTLLEGVTYRLRVSGTFRIGCGDTSGADAEYAVCPGLGTLDFCSVTPRTDLGIAINDPNTTSTNRKQPFWGAFNPTRVYTVDFVGLGAPISLSYHDCNPSDNSGSLRLDIFGPANAATDSP